MKQRDIDPAIREVVAELNSQGYKTVASCSGHPEKTEEDPFGAILFSRRYSHRKVRQIMEGFGVKIVSIKDTTNPWYPSLRTKVVFQSLGGLSIESPVDTHIERLPGKLEAVRYFSEQGASSEEAEGLASLMGYRE